jgi:hypothetical protein
MKLIRLSFYAVIAALSAVSLAFAVRAMYDDVLPGSSLMVTRARKFASESLREAGEKLA